MSENTAGDLLAAFAATRHLAETWHNPQPHCIACEGSGSLQVGTFRGWRWVDCWDCDGTGNYTGPAPQTEKDISHDD